MCLFQIYWSISNMEMIQGSIQEERPYERGGVGSAKYDTTMKKKCFKGDGVTQVLVDHFKNNWSLHSAQGHTQSTKEIQQKKLNKNFQENKFQVKKCVSKLQLFCQFLLSRT